MTIIIIILQYPTASLSGIKQVLNMIFVLLETLIQVLSLSVELSVAPQVLECRSTSCFMCAQIFMSYSHVPGWQRKCGEGGLPRRQCPQPPQHPGCHHSRSHPRLATHTNPQSKGCCVTPVHTHADFPNTQIHQMHTEWDAVLNTPHVIHQLTPPTFLHWHTNDFYIDL